MRVRGINVERSYICVLGVSMLSGHICVLWVSMLPFISTILRSDFGTVLTVQYFPLHFIVHIVSLPELRFFFYCTHCQPTRVENYILILMVEPMCICSCSFVLDIIFRQTILVKIYPLRTVIQHYVTTYIKYIHEVLISSSIMLVSYYCNYQ